MIIRTHKVMQNVRMDGCEITCCECPMTSFIGGRKHLPGDVIKKKFQDRKWEVNADGKDLCPNCAKKHLQKKSRKKAKQTAKLTVPFTEKFEMNSSFLARILAAGGFAGSKVTELENALPKFKVTFATREINVGALLICEQEVAKKFDAVIKGSYLQPELSHVNGGDTVHVTNSLHWILTLKQKDHDPTADPTKW